MVPRDKYNERSLYVEALERLKAFNPERHAWLLKDYDFCSHSFAKWLARAHTHTHTHNTISHASAHTPLTAETSSGMDALVRAAGAAPLYLVLS